MSFMRNAADDLSFMDWLFGKVDPIEQKMTDEDAYWGACLAIIEMVKSGTTCFNDMHMNKMQTTKAVKESGIRAVIGRGIVGSMEGDKPDEGGLRRINDILEEREAFKDCDRMTFCLAPHAPYTVDAPFMRYISDVAKKEGINIHVHLSESVSEIEGVKEKHGCSPIKLAADNGLFDVPCIAAHCVQVDEADIDIMKEHGVSVVSNPASNMKLGNGFAPIPAMLKKGVNVCLGTDGAASNNRLNLFHEMSLMALIHKGTERDPQVVSAKEVFKMATINGAKALGLSDKIGSLEAGKKADIAILDLNSPSLIPDNNLIAALSYSVSGSEVTGIGNNVTIDFGGFDFSDCPPRAVIIKGRSALAVNSIHIIFAGDEEEKRVLCEFEGAEEYTERSFPLSGICGRQTVRLAFLPGSSFDLAAVRFI
ncbi:MAG: amidohydrolase, partial [Lachnospiraceae bacterium]|nr:amidohydrolase [Lachnospiraceae bacterium]